MLKNRNLLILSHTYNSFIKDPVEVLSKRFNKIYVLVRYQPVAELSRYIPLSHFKSRAKYSKKQSIDLSNLPSNVEVILLPLWYLPFKKIYYYVGKRHSKVALRMLKKKDIKFDLIHAHFTWSAGYVGMKIKDEYKKPLVVTVHGYDIYDLPKRGERLKEGITQVLKSTDRVLTVSKRNKEDIKRLEKERKIEILPNGYSSSLFYHIRKDISRKKKDLPPNRRILLSVGNLETVKGYEYLIKAIKIVKINYPNILCIHIGGGSLEQSLKETVRKFGLEDNIQFLGRKLHNQLVDYYNASDMFVSSSLSEGNPTVMFETLACGKPFIGTKVGGVPDIINSKKYGLLCEPKDEKALAENIIKGLNTKWESEEILKYSQQFAWENICKKIVKIYEDLLK
jgi:glycosyltransferase involved in cell wall biosynthesis